MMNKGTEGRKIYRRFPFIDTEENFQGVLYEYFKC